MTDKLFFDTDCISSFLWVKEENLLLKLYSERVVLPKQVYDELSNPSIPHFNRKVNQLYLNEDISIKEILINTEEYKLYHQLAITPTKGEIFYGVSYFSLLFLKYLFFTKKLN